MLIYGRSAHAHEIEDWEFDHENAGVPRLYPFDEKKWDPVNLTAEWAIEKMNGYFPMNINFMLNLSPAPNGLVDDNLAEEFARIGTMAAFPEELKNLPQGWLTR